MQTPRLVILDFDGTLADSGPWLRQTLAQAGPRFGLPALAAEELEALRHQDARAALRRLGVPAWRLPAIARELRRLALLAPPPPLFPDIPETLRRLAAAGLRLAIASSNSEAQIRRTLGRELAALIGHWAVEASLFGKARRFRRIIGDAALPPAATLAIGDEVRDIEAARAVGAAAGAVAWGYAAPAFLGSRTPDVLFERPADILRFCAA